MLGKDNNRSTTNSKDSRIQGKDTWIEDPIPHFIKHPYESDKDNNDIHISTE